MPPWHNAEEGRPVSIQDLAMKYHHLVLVVAVFTVLNGCDLTESYWYLARESPLPKGLQSDAQATRAAATASQIELWIYTYHPPVLRFYDGTDEVLKREASGYRSAGPSEGDALFFVQFNGVESKFRHVTVTSSNVVEVADDPATTPTVIGLTSPGSAKQLTTRTAAPPEGYLGIRFGGARIEIVSRNGESRTLLAPPPHRIDEIIPDSPASRTNLQVGDLVVQLDGRALNGPEELVSRIRSMREGDIAKLTLRRIDGSDQVIAVTVGAQTSDARP